MSSDAALLSMSGHGEAETPEGGGNNSQSTSLTSNWLDRLGVNIPNDLLSESGLLNSDDALPIDDFDNIVQTGFPTSSVNCSVREVHMSGRQRIRTASSGSSSSLGEQDEQELAEYVRQASQQSLPNQQQHDKKEGQGVVEIAPTVNSWDTVQHWQPSQSENNLQNCTVPVNAQENLNLTERSESQDPEDEEDLSLDEDDDEFEIIEDDLLSQSPPQPRSRGSASSKGLTGNRRRQRLDAAQLRHPHIKVVRRNPGHRKRKPEIGLCFSLPASPSQAPITSGSTLSHRHQQQRQRSRRRDNERGVKANVLHLPEEDWNANKGGQPPTLPVNTTPSSPLELPLDPPGHRCESLPQLSRTVNVVRRCRYLSVSSRRLSEPSPVVPLLVPPSIGCLPLNSDGDPTTALSGDCVAFYSQLATLLRKGGEAATPATGPVSSRKISQEELLYQQELSETLWLELQAWHAQLDCFTYDNLLFSERDKVERVVFLVLNFSIPERSRDISCPNGCLSIWCSSCRRHQDKVLRQVSSIIQEIDHVEALFPSSAKMIVLYPSWGGAEFVSRCNTLYLWHSTVLQLRQAIVLLGDRLQHIANTAIPWPNFLPSSSDYNTTTSRPTCSTDEDGNVLVNKYNNEDGSLPGDLDEQPPAGSRSSSCQGSPIKLIIGGNDCHEKQTNHQASNDGRNDSQRDDISSTSSHNGKDQKVDFNSSNCTKGFPSDPTTSNGRSSFERNASTRSSTRRTDSRSSLLSPEPQLCDGVGGLKRSTSTMFLEANPYRKYVEKCMHSKGLRKTFDKIVEVIRDVMARCVCLMEQQQRNHSRHHDKLGSSLEEHCKEMLRQLHAHAAPTSPSNPSSATSATTFNYNGSSSTTAKPPRPEGDVPSDFTRQGWSGRMWILGLPGLSSLFWFLSSVPVQLVCECLSLRLSQLPKQPSELSIKQLVRECREGLRLAVSVRRRFDRWSTALTQHLRPQPLSAASSCDDDGHSKSTAATNTISGAVALQIPVNVLARTDNKLSPCPIGLNAGSGSNPWWQEAKRGGNPPSRTRHNPFTDDPDAIDISGSQLTVPKPAAGSSFSAPTSPHHRNSVCNSAPLTEPSISSPAPSSEGSASPYYSVASELSPQYATSPSQMSPWSVPPELSPLAALPNKSLGAFLEAEKLSNVSTNSADVSLKTDMKNKLVLDGLSKMKVKEQSRMERHSTDEGVALTSPDLSEASSVSGDTCPAASRALREELSRRHTKLLHDLDTNIETMLRVYLDWLDLYFPVAGSSNSAAALPGSTSGSTSFLLQEWQFVCSICPQVLHAYTLAATRFCNLAELLVTEAWDGLSNGIDELTNQCQRGALLQHSPGGHSSATDGELSVSGEMSPDARSPEQQLPALTGSAKRKGRREAPRPEVRRLVSVVGRSRRHMTRALGLARTLRDQLEVAVQYSLGRDHDRRRLLHRLHHTGHVRLQRMDRRYAIFAPNYLADDVEAITVLLSLTPLPEDHLCSFGDGAIGGGGQGVDGMVPSPRLPPATVPSLLLTSPSADTQPLLVVPSGGGASSLIPSPAGAVCGRFPSGNESYSGAGHTLAYLIILRLDGSQRSDGQEGDEDELDGQQQDLLQWKGPVVRMQPTAAVTIALASLQECEALAVCSSCSVPAVRHHLASLLPPPLLRPVHESTAPHTAVRHSLASLKAVCVEVCGRLVRCVGLAQQLLGMEEGSVRKSGPNPARDALQQLYNFGFECHRDVARLVASDSGSQKSQLAALLVSFARSWISFCRQHYSSGNGRRPRWANTGLDFLLLACNPHHLSHLPKLRAQSFQSDVVLCYRHIVGVAKAAPASPSTAPSTPGNTRRTFRSSSSASGRSGSDSTGPPTPSSADREGHLGPEFPGSTTPSPSCGPTAARRWWQQQPSREGGCVSRVRDAVVLLEQRVHQQLQNNKRVGSVVATPHSECLDSLHTRYKTVGFSWHRGFKIGSGRFGKVYTAVNNSTGELLAVKVQPLAAHDRKSVAKLVEELKILEGFKHPHLVHYYGMEVLEDELLLFMEYCSEGTLEQLSNSTESGLPEEHVRPYTRQLLDGVAALHDRGVIHRDIKGANIFLTQDSMSLKLGDFGCAVRLRGDHTQAGELAGVVGTHAFMAPEIYQCAGGHGRAADVWSLACVVIEMSTGKRPWPEYDSSAQIMFRVGMGQSPALPPSLSKEGHDFLKHCFIHNPADRSTASQLLHHPFVKVELDEDCYSLPLFSGAMNRPRPSPSQKRAY